MLGIKVQRPPPPALAAAKLVSNAISTTTPSSLQDEQDEKKEDNAQDSSTDTEDSDDSEIEQHVSSADLCSSISVAVIMMFSDRPMMGLPSQTLWPLQQATQTVILNPLLHHERKN